MRRRRGNGEGSIYQRADGRWCCTITVGYDAQGKRRRRTVFGKTKKAVQDELTKLSNQKLDGTLCEPNRISLAEYMTRWLDDVAKPKIRPTTYSCYSMVIRLHIVPHLGGVPVSKLTPLHVQGLYRAMEQDGKSGRTRQLTHAVLRKALSVALRSNMVPRNVCDGVEPPKAVKKAMQTLTPEQSNRFLKAAKGDRLFALYVLALTTGMRQGELMGLQWPDVDLERATLAVRHTLIEINGKHELGEPKSAKSRRCLVLPNVAVKALHAHRKKMLAEGHAASPWVFCDSQGGPLRKSNVIRNSHQQILKRANERAKKQAAKKGVEPELLPPIRFHDLRHTAATLMLAEGVHPKVVQERLGHATIALTLDTYSHVLPTMQKEAAAKMDRLFTALGA